MTEEIDMLTAATRKYERAERALKAAKAEVIEAALTALRAGERPTDVAEQSPFTPAYIRRIAREHGIEPAPPGPKPRRGE
jgi:hypothetical protein